MLLAVGWETDVAPEMGAPAQSIIDRQILNDADLLVGIFWTRIGTPTASYASGAVEEIEEHLKAGRPAMLYFSAAPTTLIPWILNSIARSRRSRIHASLAGCSRRTPTRRISGGSSRRTSNC
jgi:hypothetical protein